MLPVVYAFTFISCKTKVESESATIERIDPKEITPGPVVHDTLNSDQLEKVKKIQRVLEEVNPSTLEETIDDFKQDQHPDGEIESWLAMANAYEKFTSQHKALDINKKTEAYRLILMRSMENEANAKAEIGLKYLTDKEVREIFSYYTLEAKPITVEKR
jgi:accessory colonization factor AcfC